MSDSHKGVVVRSTGSWYNVKVDDGSVIPCRLRGKFRVKGIKTTNPVAVGDVVFFEYDEDNKSGLICEIGERDNYIIRKATRLSKRSHIIAVNIDQLVVIATINHPRTSTGFIDRVLVTAEAYHIPAAIVFNKTDLYDDAEIEVLNRLVGLYKSLGYKCLSTSAKKASGIEAFSALLKDRVSLLSGHSGVGKSALINCVEPGLNIRTASLSVVHNKGRHTTTFAEMFELAIGGHIIDTPGLKEFGLVDFYKYEIAERFPEMRARMYDCQFANCTHTHEPNCAVKNAVEKGEIDKGRYKNYLEILKDEYWDE